MSARVGEWAAAQLRGTLKTAPTKSAATSEAVQRAQARARQGRAPEPLSLEAPIWLPRARHEGARLREQVGASARSSPRCCWSMARGRYGHSRDLSLPLPVATPA